ncbi:MAG: carbon starvation protein A, partial [Paramuribaculum sp.]|nr:carbon starvation protein A [Paramuribaculum sp.]
TGDTALRSARLTVADFMNIDQKRLWPRMMVAFPLIAIVALIMLIDFNVLWRYFAWSNQTLSVFTLWAITVYLARNHKAYIISLVPALFMTAVTSTYLMAAPRPEGFGFDYTVALVVGGVVTLGLALIFFFKKKA